MQPKLALWNIGDNVIFKSSKKLSVGVIVAIEDREVEMRVFKKKRTFMDQSLEMVIFELFLTH